MRSSVKAPLLFRNLDIKPTRSCSYLSWLWQCHMECVYTRHVLHNASEGQSTHHEPFGKPAFLYSGPVGSLSRARWHERTGHLFNEHSEHTFRKDTQRNWHDLASHACGEGQSEEMQRGCMQSIWLCIRKLLGQITQHACRYTKGTTRIDEETGEVRQSISSSISNP